jgi:threonine dehydratase
MLGYEWFDEKEIEQIESKFPNIIKRSVLSFNRRLSHKYECKVFLKREDRQIVRSYKIRGAFNAISHYKEKAKLKGVVCASAGNHSQGVALSCHFLGIKGTIFMPKTTPLQKINKTKKFGGEFVEVKIEGDTFNEAYDSALKFEKETGAVFIHPFNDFETIKGQATIGVEILKDIKEGIDYLIVPIGGGGLISGVGMYFKKKSPETKIIGVVPEGAPAMYESLKAGKVMRLDKIDTFVDGAAVKEVGTNTLDICKNVVNRVIKVPEGRICSTILRFLQDEGIVLEPAGAMAIDALEDLKDEIKDKTVVCIASGGNLDFSRLPEINEKSLKFEGLKKYFIVNFAQRVGALREFLDLIGKNDDIVRFEYLKKSNKEKGPALIGVETNDRANFSELARKMKEKGISFEDITENEIYFSLLV